MNILISLLLENSIYSFLISKFGVIVLNGYRIAAGLELLTTGGGRGESADWGYNIGMGRSVAEGGIDKSPKIFFFSKFIIIYLFII